MNRLLVHFSVGISLLIIGYSEAASVPPEFKDVQDFLNVEFEGNDDKGKQVSSFKFPSDSNYGESENRNVKVEEPSGKPDKISVTIFKEYKVAQPGGGYLSIQKQGNDFKGSLSPPVEVQKFIQQEAAGSGGAIRNPLQIEFEKAQEVNYDFQKGLSTSDVTPSRPRSQAPLSIRPPQPAVPVPRQYKKKTMDGWIPLFGKTYIGPNKKGPVSNFKEAYAQSHYTKGVYYSPAKQDALRESASAVIPQIVAPQAIVPAIEETPEFISQSNQAGNPQLVRFTQDEVVRPNSAKQSEVIETQVKNLVIEKPKGQPRAPVYPGQNVVIHANNVIIRGDEGKSAGEVQTAPPKTTKAPSISLIKAYESTPQISALLRERFRLNRQPPHPLSGKSFPSGGVSLRSLAQAIRNGAFSLENDVIPSAASEKTGHDPNEMEIMIPHTFKLRNPPSDYYSTLNPQLYQATSASINQPVQSHDVYGGVRKAKIPTATSLSNPGLRDYGDGVKYGGKNPIEIVETSPVNGLSGGSSLNQLAQELEEKLREMVKEQLAQAVEQYGVPEKLAGKPLESYGVPEKLAAGNPVESYGVPGKHSGNPLASYNEHEQHSESYGVPEKHLESYEAPGIDHGEPLAAYGAIEKPASIPHTHTHYGGSEKPTGQLYELYEHIDDHHHHHHHEPAAIPVKPSKPYSIAVDFDTGLGDEYGHLNVNGGYEDEHHHHGHEEHHHPDPSLVDAETVGHQTKEQLIALGKNIFYGALDFSRKYNPITFYQKVKEFPPVRFEVYDSKDHHSKAKKKNSKN